jgi:Uma2 family endonuclease
VATLPGARLTVDEYLDLDRRSERRNEYHDGEVFPIEAASLNHGKIQGNTYVALRERLAKTDCAPLLTSVRVEIGRFHRFTYPDLLITCGKLDLAPDQQKDTLLNPVVIFEVLSPSTAGFDRGEKFSLYQSVTSLREYVLVSQDRVLVECYRRQNDRQWLYEALSSLDSELVIDSAACAIPLREIYANIDFGNP